MTDDVRRLQRGSNIDFTMGVSEPAITAMAEVMRTLIPEMPFTEPRAVMQETPDHTVTQDAFYKHRTRLMELCRTSQIARNARPTRTRGNEAWKQVKTTVGVELMEVLGMMIKPTGRTMSDGSRERTYKLTFNEAVLGWASHYRKWQMDLQQAGPAGAKTRNDEKKKTACEHGHRGFCNSCKVVDDASARNAIKRKRPPLEGAAKRLKTTPHMVTLC